MLSKNESGSLLTHVILEKMRPCGRVLSCGDATVGFFSGPNTIQIVIEEAGEPTVSFKCQAVKDAAEDLLSCAMLKKSGSPCRSVPTDMEFFLDAAFPLIMFCLLGEED